MSRFVCSRMKTPCSPRSFWVGYLHCAPVVANFSSVVCYKHAWFSPVLCPGEGWLVGCGREVLASVTCCRCLMSIFQGLFCAPLAGPGNHAGEFILGQTWSSWCSSTLMAPGSTLWAWPSQSAGIKGIKSASACLGCPAGVCLPVPSCNKHLRPSPSWFQWLWQPRGAGQSLPALQEHSCCL